MSSITDLADLIAANRARLERAFDGEIARLRAMHGDRAIDEALRIVRRTVADTSAGIMVQPPTCTARAPR
jgi:hypothetical protein